MEKKKAFRPELEWHLWLWAAWIIAINSGKAGWPSESLFAKFAKYGFVPHESVRGSREPFRSNPKAELVNTYVNELIRTHPAWGDAVYAHYTSRRSKSQQMMAAERDISARGFRDRLKRGRDWLQDKLGLR